MRLVQVTIPTGKRETVLSALDDEGVDYVVSDETSGRDYAAVVSFPLPPNAVEPILERLREAGIERDAYTVVIDAETVVSEKVDLLKDQYEAEGNGERIARQELEATARELAPSFTTFLAMTVISVVIATAGLLLDSPAVVVGSMVIAPLIGPAMATSVGTVIDDRDLFVRGVRLQVIGFSTAILSAAAFAWVIKSIHLVPPGLDVVAIPEVAERVAPDVLSLAVALGAGVAGALSLRSGVSASLVGVMIAVALVPPTATIGIGIAWGLPTVVVGASVLVLVNALSINLAAMATFWYSGYRPENWFRMDQARSATITRIMALVIAILVLSVFLGGVTYGSFQRSAIEQTVSDDVGRVLQDPAYDDLRVIEIEVQYVDGSPVRLVDPRPQRVIVTVGRPNGERYPGLADAIEAELGNLTGDPSVEVRFLAVQRAGAVGSVAGPRFAGFDRVSTAVR